MANFHTQAMKAARMKENNLDILNTINNKYLKKEIFKFDRLDFKDDHEEEMIGDISENQHSKKSYTFKLHTNYIKTKNIMLDNVFYKRYNTHNN
tara:strand:+ start:1136 stop:1417 length:282 start_codon:yes stop_codon:yes gene_type:complete